MICTSIEQSKKLIKLGIDIETADMYYYTVNGDLYKTPNIIESKDDLYVDEKSIPAWSLSALLGFIKSEIYGEDVYGKTVTYKVDFRKYKFTDDIDLYQIAYGSIKFDVDGQHTFKDMVNTGEKENLIDACVEMIVWLKENKKI